MKPEDMKDEWRQAEIVKLEARMEARAKNMLDKVGVVAEINRQAEPTQEELDSTGDLALGILSQDERVAVDAQLEIDQNSMEHHWEVTFFLPSLLEGDSIVTADCVYGYVRETSIPDDENDMINSWLERECDRIYQHVERNEEENRENYRHDRLVKWQREQDDRELERLEEERRERIKAEDAWIKEEVRLLDPLVGVF
ncbi:MAG: hypothetical protein NXH70_02330 [Hyphomonas sp.]|nr:hypothetical protein [Hyphomonas sp.]